jgi:hypothetical protein
VLVRFQSRCRFVEFLPETRRVFFEGSCGAFTRLIDITSRFRIEPEVGYCRNSTSNERVGTLAQTSTSSSAHLHVGAGAFGSASPERFTSRAQYGGAATDVAAGTDLRRLERLNGRPFRLEGFLHPW